MTVREAATRLKVGKTALYKAREGTLLKPQSKHEERVMHERDPNVVTSSLSGFVTEQGVTVRVSVIRLE